MIFVTLGTHPAPMDRLVRTLDALVEAGEIDEEVVIQAAAFAQAPHRLRAVGVAPFQQVAAWMEEATVVVCHGGPGTIMQALRAGHHPVVVPRDPAASEHVDDHQVRFAAWLATRVPIHVIRDMADLGPAIRVSASEREGAGALARPERAIARLRDIIAAP